jgi:hypothetical protein
MIIVRSEPFDCIFIFSSVCRIETVCSAIFVARRRPGDKGRGHKPQLIVVFKSHSSFPATVFTLLMLM